MTRASSELVDALRRTAQRLTTEAPYQWGHMGQCNCGHLARSITGLTDREIHAAALRREGDWERQAEEYCPTSGLLIDHILAAMLSIGLTTEDVRHLEKLSDPEVLRRLPLEQRNLARNRRADVVLYMQTWADLLDTQIVGATLCVALGRPAGSPLRSP